MRVGDDADDELDRVLAEVAAGRLKVEKPAKGGCVRGKVRTATGLVRVVVDRRGELVTILPDCTRGGAGHVFKLGNVLGR